jgi:[acyl-carrier-protein] S-malonyltransferase
MGKDLADTFAAARETFNEVDDALGENLTALMFDGPEDMLTLTENAQPALMAVSMAIIRTLADEGGVTPHTHAQYVAGHSLGEYSALTAVDTFTIGDAARLLKTRGQAMQQAVPVGKGAMAAILGLDLEIVEAVARDAMEPQGAEGGEMCTVANDNAPGQVVLSGSTATIDRAIDLAKERGARRSIKLAVSAPFHCALMAPAADAMKDALSRTALSPPAVPLIANVTAAVVTDPDQIKSLLVDQVTARVRWRESILAMKEAGTTQLVEIGSGKVLTGLSKRIAGDLDAVNISTADDVKTFLNTL